MQSSLSGIRLRALEPSDIDCLYIWENDPAMWRHGVSCAPCSRHQIWEYVHNYDADPIRSGQIRLMIEAAGNPVGCIDLYDIDIRNRHAFIGVMIVPEHRRNGYALQALNLMADYAQNTLHLNQLAATVANDNAESIALFTRAGYAITARLTSWVQTRTGQYSDACIFQLIFQGTPDHNR